MPGLSCFRGHRSPSVPPTLVLRLFPHPRFFRSGNPGGFGGFLGDAVSRPWTGTTTEGTLFFGKFYFFPSVCFSRKHALGNYPLNYAVVTIWHVRLTKGRYHASPSFGPFSIKGHFLFYFFSDFFPSKPCAALFIRSLRSDIMPVVPTEALGPPSPFSSVSPPPLVLLSHLSRYFCAC